MSSTAIDRVHIGRFRATYHIAVDHPDGEGVRRRLDSVMAGPLTRALAATLEHPLPVEDGVWLIDRLALDLQMDIDCPPDVIARHWARHIALGVVRAVHAGEGVVHFPDRARFLAAFLVDLAEGVAWSRWYWRPFDGLKALPVATALRTAVLDDPERGLAALLAIEDGARQRVFAALTEGEAQRLLAGLSMVDETDFSAARAVSLALTKTWELAGDKPAITALTLYLRVVDVAPKLAGPTLAALTQALASLAAVRLRLAPTALAPLARALLRSDRGSLLQSAGAGGGPALLPLLTLPEPARRVAADWLVGHEPTSSQTPLLEGESGSRAATVPRHSRFGGALMLLPLLDQLPLARVTADWPGLEETTAAALLRLLVLAKSVGRDNALALILDPLIRELLGIAPRLLPRMMSDWTATIASRRWRALQRAIAEAGPPSRRAALRFIWHASLRGGVGVVLATEDHWLLCAPTRPAPSSRWFRGVGIAQPPPAVAETTCEKVTRDLEWLTLPPLLCRSRTADAALSLAARALLRAAAARLPGFAGSSAPYLWRNFLDVPGRLLDEGEARLVHLGRPPIQVVLSQSGLARARFTVSWLDERPFVLGEED